MHQIIRRASKKGIKSTISEQAIFEHDPAVEFDARGRLRRWVKEAQKLDEDRSRACCGSADEQHELRFVEKLEAYQNRLYADLEVRSRALKNWKKLRN